MITMYGHYVVLRFRRLQTRLVTPSVVEPITAGRANPLMRLRDIAWQKDARPIRASQASQFLFFQLAVFQIRAGPSQHDNQRQ